MSLTLHKLSAHLWSAHAEGETPVPIPNTEVKPLRADGSVFVRICESRSVLLKIKKDPAINLVGSFFILLRAFRKSFYLG